MNLMVNNYCNLHCPYCFAQEEMHSKKAMNITMENLDKYLDFAKKEIEQGNNDFCQVRFIGGEPSLHPQLSKLIDKVINYKCFNDILIFTNLTFPHDVAEMLVEKSKKIHISLLPNVNNLDYLLPERRKNLLYNLDYLTIALPDFNQISINIYSHDQDLTVWERIICKYNLKSIRWSIVVPNKKIDETFNVRDYFHSFQPILLQLAQWAKKYHVYLNCDCSQVPLCALDSWAVVEILKTAPDFFARGGLTCSHEVLDITPTLKVVNCFGVASVLPNLKNKQLTDFNSYRELKNYYRDLTEDYAKHYVATTACTSCDRFKTADQCCACLGYRIFKVEDQNEN